jgi:hypothetical protein
MLREFQENKNKIIAEQSRIKKIIGFNDEWNREKDLDNKGE